MNEVTLSIVSYCQKELLRRCLAQLERLKCIHEWETIVVDNCSTDGSADMVEKHYPWAKLVRLGENIGFAGGHSLAYRTSSAPVFVVLNPDVIVLPDSIERLLQALALHPRAAIAGPCLLNPDGSCQFSARRFYTWRTVLWRRLPLPGRTKVHNYHLMMDVKPNRVIQVDWILGAAMAIRRSAFGTSGLFDTRYRLYFEDVDLCYFAQRRGWHVIYCPESRMIHDHQRSSAKKIFSQATMKHIESWIKFWLKTKRDQNEQLPVYHERAVPMSKSG
jgi:N-acetylglucosaminyl-diphospho-decaprenol L-rhamnosyltransferase